MLCWEYGVNYFYSLILKNLLNIANHFNRSCRFFKERQKWQQLLPSGLRSCQKLANLLYVTTQVILVFILLEVFFCYIISFPNLVLSPSVNPNRHTSASQVKICTFHLSAIFKFNVGNIRMSNPATFLQVGQLRLTMTHPFSYLERN